MAASSDGLMRSPPARPGESEAPPLGCASQGQHESTNLRHGERDEFNRAMLWLVANCFMAGIEPEDDQKSVRQQG